MTQQRLTFWEHVGELRSRLRVVAYFAIIILVVVLFFPSNPVYQLHHLGDYFDLQFLNNTVNAYFLHSVKAEILPPGWKLIAAGGLGEGMEIYFIAGILLALALCMPVIAYEVYKFIDPALKENERKLIWPFVSASSALLVTGILFGYFVLAHFLVIFLAPFFYSAGISLNVDAASFYYVILLIIAATGVSFTSPVFVYALISLRVIDPDFFSKNRVIIWFVVWVIAGLFLTPDGGPLLDMVLFVPLITLIEAAVFLGRRQARGKGPALFGTPKKEPENKCPYCSTKLIQGQPFCPKCGRYSPQQQD
jgi:sec-independent protein translocase protein TatC